MKHAFVAALMLASCPAWATAQEYYVQPEPSVVTDPSYAAPQPQADYSVSNALHITAAVALPVGTIGIISGFLMFLNGSGGLIGMGSSDTGLAAGGFAILIVGSVLETAGLALGITAVVMHSSTRGRLLSAPVVPVAWATPGGAGAGLSGRF
jgi:hypothetical protein